MSNPLVKLQGLRREISRMSDDDKKAFHSAKKAIKALGSQHGKIFELALLEAVLDGAVKRGDS